MDVKLSESYSGPLKRITDFEPWLDDMAAEIAKWSEEKLQNARQRCLMCACRMAISARRC